MLAVCKGNGLFDTVPEKQFPYDCPFVIADNYDELRNYYVTPSGGCLVYYKGSFYDPCRHRTKACSSSSPSSSSQAKVSFTLAEIVADSARTRIRFDVRSTEGSGGEMLGSWPIRFYDRDEGKNAVAAQVVERILRWRATSSSSEAETDEAAAFEADNLAANAQSRSANIPWRLSKEFIQVGGGSYPTMFVCVDDL